MTNSNITHLLKSMLADETSIHVLSDYLGYSIGKNPINESSDWLILFTDKLPSNEKGVIAAKTVSEVNKNSTTSEIRGLYKHVLELRTELSTDFDVQIVAFIGINRIVFFPLQNGNRDTRLDINEETSDKTLYIQNLNFLKNENITVIEDEFGFGDYEIRVPIDVFKQSLSTHFLTVIAYYRKKLSELITSTSLKKYLFSLLDDRTKAYLEVNDLVSLVGEKSYTSVLSNVVDTIILRQLMRRFLEGYYGADSFDVNGIALGVGSGTLDEAIKKTVEAEAAIHIGDEDTIKRLNKKKQEIRDYEEISLFEDFFDDDEKKATTQIDLKTESKKRIQELTKIATKQFKVVYNGDLFANSIGKAADLIEQQMAEDYPEFVAKLWLDTSAQEYSFRYQDMPPNAIEKQYELSMSQNVQIKIENNKPIVYYGNDFQEQKNKGAYYTDEKFVNYMVKQTVEKEFSTRFEKIKLAILEQNDLKIRKSIIYLLDMKVVDLTAGGGSFLRGAFLLLAGKQPLLANLNLSNKILEEFPFLSSGDDSIYLWEKYVLEHMIYGIDIDYKAIIISSLTLTLSSLEHRPRDMQLPSLIGRNLIHQNSLINSVPFYLRKKVYLEYQEDIKQLRKAKSTDFKKFQKIRNKLQGVLLKFTNDFLQGQVAFLHVEAIEINLPEIFFNEDGSLNEDGGFDIVIGNPPWEVWKPNSDEFYSKYDDTYLKLKKAKEKKELQKQLIKKFPSIKKKWEEVEEQYKSGSKYFRDCNNFKYQSWIVEGRKTGSDINLYKISLERFLQLSSNGARLSVLVPDNIMTDLGATGLRHLIFDENILEEFLSFENRKGIFSAVDGRYKFAVTTILKSKEKVQSFKSFFYKHDLSLLENEEIKIPYPMELVFTESEKYSLCEPKSQIDLDLYRKIKLRYSSLLETKLFEISNDFHRTNDSDYFFENLEEGIPLYEGKLMEQFKIIKDPSESVSREVAKLRTGQDYSEWRIGIRAVGSATNRRTLIATVFPPFTVATHSLHMQRKATYQTVSEKLYLVGLLNSYVIDFTLRQLMTMNISQSFIKQLPIPPKEEFMFADDIIQISYELLRLNGKVYDSLEIDQDSLKFSGLGYVELTAELNARVALGFDLNRAELINLLKTFESVNHKKFIQEEAQRIIDVFDILNEKLGEIE